MLPNFLLVGATKAGTTSLFAALAGHPQVWMHPVKELRFFTTQHNWHRGPGWYRAQFAQAPADARAVGEASNAYSRHPAYAGVPERIASLRPDMKIVYLTRDPMARLASHYRHRLVTGIEWREPSRAVREDPRYLAASLSADQVERYLEHFSRRQLFVARSERLFDDPAAVLGPLAAFLGIDGDAWPALRLHNVTAERRVAPAPLRQLVRLPGARLPVKRVARTIAASPLARYLAPAGSVPFDLEPALHARLEDRFAEDERRLARLLGPDAETRAA